MNYWLILIPLISAFIGYITNLIAIKMLFHPRKPIRFLGLTIQGIFPKRQQQFAEKLGKLVSNELLSFDDIATKLSNPDNLKQLSPLIENHLDHFLRNKLAAEMPIISAFVGEKTISKLKSVFLEELNSLFPGLMQQYSSNLRQSLDLEKIVIEKVSGFSSDKLESILLQIMAKEFRFVEIIGGVIGLFIGLVQVAITLISS